MKDVVEISLDAFVRVVLESSRNLANLTSTQERCTSLEEEGRVQRREIARLKMALGASCHALRTIAECNDGKGFMPELARETLKIVGEE